MRLLIRLCILLLIPGSGLLFSQTIQHPLDRLAIEVPADKDGNFVFSNKIAAFWFGEIQRQNQTAHQGYTIYEQRYLKDYRLLVNQEEVVRSGSVQTMLYPDRLTRNFPAHRETFIFHDSLNAIHLQITPNNPESSQRMPLKSLTFIPEFDDLIGHPDWQWNDRDRIVMAQLPAFGGKHFWAAISAWGEMSAIEILMDTVEVMTAAAPAEDEGNKSKKKKKKKKYEVRQIPRFSGLMIRDPADIAVSVVFDTSRSALLNAVNRLKSLRPEGNHKHTTSRRQRLQRLLKGNRLNSGDASLDKAFSWALISMDDLVTRQRGSGIWAGLPWFNNYWGRDSFIALTGALLATGQYETAREVLLAFSKFQNTNPANRNYGRIPNRVMLNDIIYNTADGTPWFVIACEKYVQYSGDRDFIEEIFPVIKRATEGASKYHVDEYGYLTHGDAETWMDAVGTEGPWSPRATRAVEIQVLWMEQLRIAASWGLRLGHSDWIRSWELSRKRLVRNFQQDFLDIENNRIIDHLNGDKSPDQQFRPNGIFALTLSQIPLMEADQAGKMLAELTGRLLFPQGAASLAQHDNNFHPYHHYAPYYVPDAAYHNGLIWTWLNGRFISAIMHFNPDNGFRLLEETSRQILDQNALGSYAELLEAWPRKNREKPLISGAVSQAWSLAEFIRNWHEDLLGLRPNFDEDVLHFQPQLPEALTSVKRNFRLKNDMAVLLISQTDSQRRFQFNGKEDPAPILVKARIPLGEQWLLFDHFWKGESFDIQVDVMDGVATLMVDGEKMIFRREDRVHLAEIPFANPDTTLSPGALNGPAYALIKPEQAVQEPGRRDAVLFDIKDPEGDDVGVNESYLYPQNPNFKPGIFDGRRIRIRRNAGYYFFELELSDLADPGWRPEPGFQLTFLAITLRFEKLSTVQRTRVDMSANYSVPLEYGYNFVIFVGNGYRISDARGNIVAEYQPVDSDHPIGFVSEKKIRFSVPVEYLSDNHLENAVVLIGGQDDHGGGGIGEFRAVLGLPGDWHGGGGEDPDNNSSVYDIIKVRR